MSAPSKLDDLISNAGHSWFDLEPITDFSSWPEATDREGILYKKPRGGGLKNMFVKNKWTRRRFSLSVRDSRMFYFDCNSGEVKGTITLTKVQARLAPPAEGRHVFELREILPDKSTHNILLQASSDDQRIQWIKNVLLVTKYKEIKAAIANQKQTSIQDTNLSLSEVYLNDAPGKNNSTTQEKSNQLEESSAQKAERLKGFKKRNTIAQSIRKSISKPVDKITVTTMKKGQRLPKPPSEVGIGEALRESISINASIVSKNLKPLIEDSKDMIEIAQHQSQEQGKKTRESIRRSSVAIKQNFAPLQKDLAMLNEELGEQTTRVSENIRKSISQSAVQTDKAIRQSVRRTSMALQKNVSAIREEIDESSKRTSQRIRESVTDIPNAVRRSSLAVKENFAPLTKDLKDTGSVVKKQVRRSMSLGSSGGRSSTGIRPSSTSSLSSVNEASPGDRLSTSKLFSGGSKYGFQMMEEDNDRPRVEIVNTTKSVAKAPGGPPPPSPTSSTENENTSTNKDASSSENNTILEQEEKEIKVEEGPNTEEKKEKDITVVEESSNRKEEGANNKSSPEEEPKNKEEGTEGKQDEVKEEVQKEGGEEVISETEGDTTTRNERASSKSRASIRYLESIQRNSFDATKEEPPKEQQPKKREKRVSIATQRYLAATSKSNIEDNALTQDIIIETEEEEKDEQQSVNKDNEASSDSGKEIEVVEGA